MGGWHIPLRFTNSSSYIGINSTFIVPASMSAVYSSSNPSINIVPEFFYNFERGSQNIDIGILYTGSGFKVFQGSQNCCLSPWNDSTITGISKGDTIHMAAYLASQAIFLDITRANGTQINASFDLLPSAYSNMMNGCKIARELCIAANDPNYMQSSVYFTSGKFSGSTLTTTSYQYIKLSTSNSTASRVSDDSNQPTPSLTPWTAANDSNGFVYDLSSCRFR